MVTPAHGVGAAGPGTDPTLPAAASAQTGAGKQRTARGWWLVAGGAVALVAAGVAVFALTRSSGGDTEQAVVVIDDRTSAPGDRPTAKPVDDHPADVEPVASGSARAEPVVDRPAHPPADVSTAQLTRAFARHTTAITSCFREQHVDTSEQLFVRFQIDVKGRVVAATVLPESVASSPLGRCIEGVARTVTFGPQPKAVTFRAPIQAVAKGS